MAIGDLTSLANVKAWRNPQVQSELQDPQIKRVITVASRTILQDIQRTLLSTAYSEIRDGDGSTRLSLNEWPVTAISALTVDGTAIPASTSADPTSSGYEGYLLDPETGLVRLRGFRFTRGQRNVEIDYTAGYLVSGEAQSIPGSSPWQLAVSNLGEVFAADAGVSFSGGAALTAVTANPVTGQYVPPAGPGGSYAFAQADANRAILISYSFTPAELEQACIELVILRLNESSRIGELSKTLAGETVSFFNRSALTGPIDAYLQPYRRVVLASP